MKIQLPEFLDLNRPVNYELIIGVRAEQFDFALRDLANDSVFFYQEIPRNKREDAITNFKTFFFENEYLALSYNKVTIVNYTSEFTFVPSILFEKKDKETWMDFNFLENKGQLLTQSLSKPELTILHVIPEEIFSFFQRSFINPQFIHHSSTLISYFQNKFRLDSVQSMVVNLQMDGLDLVCFSQGNFILGNQFHPKDIQETVYYILFTWKQLKFDQERDIVHVAGNTEQKTILTEEIKKYIREVRPVNITFGGHSSDANIQQVPVEFLALSLCEL